MIEIEPFRNTTIKVLILTMSTKYKSAVRRYGARVEDGERPLRGLAEGYYGPTVGRPVIQFTQI